MAIITQPIQVETGCSDRAGLLVLDKGLLVAVLVRLDDAAHEEDLRGRWFLECAFGKLRKATQPVFASLEAALQWIEGHVPTPDSTVQVQMGRMGT
jgi:hypothetical protein